MKNKRDRPAAEVAGDRGLSRGNGIGEPEPSGSRDDDVLYQVQHGLVDCLQGINVSDRAAALRFVIDELDRYAAKARDALAILEGADGDVYVY